MPTHISSPAMTCPFSASRRILTSGVFSSAAFALAGIRAVNDKIVMSVRKKARIFKDVLWSLLAHL